SKFELMPSSMLNVPRVGHTTVVAGTSLYVIGGSNSFTSGTGFDTLERATINADGSLSKFELMPTSMLNVQRVGHTTVVAGNSLYVIGGSNSFKSGTGFDTLERATINADGSLSKFGLMPTSMLDVPRVGHTTVVANNSLYVIGGSNSF